MPKGVYKRKSPKERFYEQLPPESERKPDECWEWKAYCNQKRGGYGRIKVCKKQILAHRMAWELANNRKIPEGMYVLHHCDNPPCCNPEHLYLGTNQDNVRDRDTRGRGSANVPDWIIKEALKYLLTGVTQRKVAEMLTKKGYPCCQATVSNWVRGESRSMRRER